MTSPREREQQATGGVTLRDIAAEHPAEQMQILGDGDVRVRDVRQDSRRIRPGDLFVARTGGSADGRCFIGDAVARGATAVLLGSAEPQGELPVPALIADDVDRALALAAEAVHGHPTQKLGVVGITGTNGKTTVAWMVESVLAQLGQRPALSGTLGFRYDGRDLGGQLTTPEADDLSRLAAQVVREGATHLVMEVSSHALSRARVAAVDFDVVVFTNLSQDHLDFHATMESYAAAKRALFTDFEPSAAVLNADDAYGAFMGEGTRAKDCYRITRANAAEADVFARDVRSLAQGLHASVDFRSQSVEIDSRLVGEHNLDNLLSALVASAALGLEPSRVAAALASVPQVPGRLERCDHPVDDVTVLVDYAHTPDALERALEAVRPLTEGRVICVFGCGGDRDPDKRPKMGAAVARGADIAVLTNDNPRTEDPQAIAAAVLAGLETVGTPHRVELDRQVAIEQAVAEAQPGDLVLVAGKGHEPYQILGSQRLPFDDRVACRRALALRRGRLSA